jgi:hypothetical protein
MRSWKFPYKRSMFTKSTAISIRGLRLHRSHCEYQNSSCCTPQLYICTTGCWTSILAGKNPKFAIAQGYWIGQLPPDLRNMTFGTLSLLRFSPLVEWCRTQLLRVEWVAHGSPDISIKQNWIQHWWGLKFLLHPKDAPVKVLVVSQFAPDKSAAAKDKLANTKQD